MDNFYKGRRTKLYWLTTKAFCVIWVCMSSSLSSSKQASKQTRKQASKQTNKQFYKQAYSPRSNLAVGALGAKEEVGVVHEQWVVHGKRQLDVAQVARALFST
jgi:hypothetical protein